MTKIFVSHSEQDSNIAKALVDFLLSALQIDDDDIRCTSVPGHTLKFGKTIPELLKSDLNEAPAIIALITEQSLTSRWVMFELGAAWALDSTIYPILGPALSLKDLPGPLSNHPCILINESNSSSRMRDMIKQLSTELKISEKTGGKAQANLETFLQQFREPLTVGSNKVLRSDGLDDKTTVLSAIWEMDSESYIEIGYSIEMIAKKSGKAIPMCKYILDGLIEETLVQMKKYIGGTIGERYTLTTKGRERILKKNN